MKTSHILLATIAVLTLTGMVATDVLLKEQYNKIDWHNPYQHFEQKALPVARHLVLDGTPTHEIIMMQRADQPQALVEPDRTKSYRFWQQKDTLFIMFTADKEGYQSEPRADADHELGAELVLRLPALQTMRIKNGRLTLRGFSTDALKIELQNSRLRTDKLKVTGSCELIASQNSFAVLSHDQYTSLQTVVLDSSGVRLNDTQTEVFTPKMSLQAEVQLRGRALHWLTK